ncbi:MAG: PPC domain-containing DNA-binding protein [Methanotrichaceae archaeon]
MIIRELERGRSILARLDFSAEIVESITSLAEKTDIKVGTFSAIGALQQAELGYYEQDSHQYKVMEVDGPVELVSCTGNISIRDGKPFVHPHASLANSDGNLRGGHLHSGTIFAAELYIQELKGEPFIRIHDPITDLYLWS